MARGQAKEDGETFINRNGYHHTKVDGKWVATHRILAERKLGRSLEADEFVSFADGDRTNLEMENIVVKKRNKTSARRRLAQVEARLEELKAEREALLGELREDG